MPIWEAPTSASGAARAALKTLKPGQQQQAPRGLDSLFKKQEPAWARLLGSMSNKEQAVALCLLLGTTVIIMAHMCWRNMHCVGSRHVLYEFCRF